MLERSERKDSAYHRQLILETARQLFDAHGINDVSMHQIARAAGIGQGTLYRKYSCKGDLCIDLLKESFKRFTGRTDAMLTELQHEPVRARFGRLLIDWISFLGDKLEWIRTLHTVDLDERIHFYNAPPCTYMRDVLVRLLDEAVQRGESRIADTKFAAFHILSSISPEALLYWMQERNGSLEQAAADHIRYYTATLFD